ncbi:MAG: hypothetical protein E7369_01865 [Clostridiales bacterium]|nr:hypothetical protein [Clostridiales bacterium]
MKKFRFNYPTVVWVLIALVCLLSVAGLVWNIYNLIYFFPISVVKTVGYIIIVLLNGALSVVAISLVVYGRYVIKDGYIYACFGIIRTKYEIADVVEVAYFKKTDKLVVYFSDAKYTVIVISPTDYDEFVSEIRKINKKIIYGNKIEGQA